MADKEGNKTGGRVAGTPNKRTKELRDKAEELGVDVAEFLMLYLKGDRRALGYMDRYEQRRIDWERGKEEHEAMLEMMSPAKRKKAAPYPDFVELTEEEINDLNMLDPHARKEAAVDLLPYLFPKRKPVDSKGDDQGQVIQIVIDGDDAKL